jgi:hypothetical protein
VNCHQPDGCQCWHYWNFIDAYKITFSSGFFLACINGACSINNGPAGASITKSASNVQCFEINPSVSERVMSTAFGTNGQGTSNELYNVAITTNAQNPFTYFNWPYSITDVNAGKYLLDGTNFSFSAPTKSLAQLQSNLQKWQSARQEDLYRRFLDGTTSSGFLCGAGLSYSSTNTSLTDATGANRAWGYVIKQFGMIFMHPVAPINGYAIDPFSITTANTQPVQNSDTLSIVSRSNDVSCSGPGNGYSAVTESFTISSGTTWSLQGTQQTTFGENLGNEWSVSANLQIGSSWGPSMSQVNIDASYTSDRTSTSQTVTATTTSSNGGKIQNTNVQLPFVCPKGPNYNVGIQCSFSAGAAWSTSFASVAWQSHGTYTLVSGKQFKVPMGGTVSGTLISTDIQIYDVMCEGVYYASYVCQLDPGTIIQCTGEYNATQYYTTQQTYDSHGKPKGITITELASYQYAALGSPIPNAVLDSCAQIQEACSNLVVATPPPPLSPPLAPPLPAAASSSFNVVQVTSYSQMLQIAQSYEEVHLLLGTGYDTPFLNVSSVLASLMPYLEAIQNKAKGEWLLIWGGSQPTSGLAWAGPGRIPSMAADIKYLVAQIKQLFDVKVLVVASDGFALNICDYCFLVPPALQQLAPSTNATIYAGASLNSSTSKAVLVGGTRYYLSSDFVGNINSPGILRTLMVAGGGTAQQQELSYASSASLPWRYFPSQPISPIDAILPLLVQNNIAVQEADGSYCGNCDMMRNRR